MIRRSRSGARIALALLTVLLLFVSTGLFAQTSTLDVILKRGKFIVGIDLSNPPYGMYDAKKEPAGFDVELSQLIAKELGVELEIVDIRSVNRIPYLVTNKIDATIATFGCTPERAKSVAFTWPYAAWPLVMVGYKSDPSVKGMQDLSGKKVGITRGTTQDIALTNRAPAGTDIIRYEDDPTTFMAIQTKKVDVIGTALLMAGEMIKKNPALELKGTIDSSWASIAVRRGDLEWLQWLNNFLWWHGGKGNLAVMYEKWNGIPMTPAFPQW